MGPSCSAVEITEIQFLSTQVKFISAEHGELRVVPDKLMRVFTRLREHSDGSIIRLVGSDLIHDGTNSQYVSIFYMV